MSDNLVPKEDAVILNSPTDSKALERNEEDGKLIPQVILTMLMCETIWGVKRTLVSIKHESIHHCEYTRLLLTLIEMQKSLQCEDFYKSDRRSLVTAVLTS